MFRLETRLWPASSDSAVEALKPGGYNRESVLPGRFVVSPEESSSDARLLTEARVTPILFSVAAHKSGKQIHDECVLVRNKRGAASV